VTPQTLSRLTSVALVAVCGLNASSTPADAQKVRVVNLIPNAQSSETTFNSESFIAVNPRNPNQIAVSAHYAHVGYCMSPVRSAIFVSVDGGTTWAARCKLDSSDISWPKDITLAFSGDGQKLYAGYLLSDTAGLWSASFGTSDDPTSDAMSVAETKTGIDQPHLHAPTTAGNRTLLIAANDGALYTPSGSPPCYSGAVYHTSDIELPAQLGVHCVATRTSPTSTPAVRAASHTDGTMYAVFYRTVPTGNYVNDVVVVRTDPSSGTFFADLLDLPAKNFGIPCRRRDGLPGYRVARCRPVPYGPSEDAAFGQEWRRNSSLAIAVDPRTSGTVYIAWADSMNSKHQTLRVRKSTNRGKTWTADLFTVPDATNPALAVDAQGTVGFLYQQLTGNNNRRWKTRVVLSRDNFATRRNIILADAPALEPPCSMGWCDPYIGDYLHLTAVGTTFYGAFSTSNDPSKVIFPHGVIFDRTVVAGHLSDASNADVSPSIDPYFFSIKKVRGSWWLPAAPD
jgi:hypothetical protein